MRVYVVRKWPLRGEKSFCVSEYHTSKSVLTVQRAFRAKYAKGPAYRQDHTNNLLKLGVCASRKYPMLTRVWQELEYRIAVCRVTCGAHIEHL